MFFFSEKINIRYLVNELCKQCILCLSFNFEEKFNLAPEKISFDLSQTMSPVILCRVAKQVMIKFIPKASLQSKMSL